MSALSSAQLQLSAVPSNGFSSDLTTPPLSSQMNWGMSDLHQQSQWWRSQNRSSSPLTPTPAPSIDPILNPGDPLNFGNSIATASPLALDPLLNTTSAFVSGRLNQSDRNNYYRLDISVPTTLNLRVGSIPWIDPARNRWVTFTKVDLLRQNSDGSLSVVSRTRGRGERVSTEENTWFVMSGIDVGRLNPGTYFLRTYSDRTYQTLQNPVDLPYNLSLNTAPSTPAKRFKIEFDYRFDKRGFFRNPVRRRALEAAADYWENFIGDNFSEVPRGTQFTVTNPETGRKELVRLNRSIDDVRIFVGARSKPAGDGNSGAAGGPDGLDAKGAIFRNRIRGSKFEPWAGSIAFDTDVRQWYSDPQPSSWDVPFGWTDLFSVALHQIGHVLGIGTAPVFQRKAVGTSFNGFYAKQVNNGRPIPLTRDLRHIRPGFRSDGQFPLMNSSRRIDRVLPTPADRALLADLGYNIPGITSQTFNPTSNSTES